MDSLTVEEVYERYVRPLSPEDQMRLLAMARQQLDVGQDGDGRARRYTCQEVASFIEANKVEPATIRRVTRRLRR
jgi:hypothetical protein